MTSEDRERDEGAIEPDDGYVSPVLARLERAPRPRSPVRGLLAGSGSGPAERIGRAEERLAGTEARLARLEWEHRELVDNLYRAHDAFRQLTDRVEHLAGLVERALGPGR